MGNVHNTSELKIKNRRLVTRHRSEFGVCYQNRSSKAMSGNANRADTALTTAHWEHRNGPSGHVNGGKLQACHATIKCEGLLCGISRLFCFISRSK
jgi:hypothetical protein